MSDSPLDPFSDWLPGNDIGRILGADRIPVWFIAEGQLHAGEYEYDAALGEMDGAYAGTFSAGAVTVEPMVTDWWRLRTDDVRPPLPEE